MVDRKTPILVVDDDPHMRQIIRAMLRGLGFTAVHEHDGRHSLSVLRRRPFGLVLSELSSKWMSGLELLRRLRTEPELCAMPYILVSGPAQFDVVKAAVALGVDAYLVKPFSAQALDQKVQAAVEHASRAACQRMVEAERAHADTETVALAELNRSIVRLLAMMRKRIKEGDHSPQDDLLHLVRAYLDRAVTLGIEDSYRRQFETIIGELTSELGRQDAEKSKVIAPSFEDPDSPHAGRGPAAA